MNTVQKLQFCLVLGMAVLTASEFTSDLYDLKTNFITSYEEVVTVPSPLTCVTKCSRRTDCHYCAYNSSTGQCFLHVLFENTKDVEVRDVAVFADDRGAVCDHSSAVNFTTTTVTWKSSGLEGNLSCRQDYIYSGDNTTIACSASGKWEADGSCRQKIWRNPSNILDFALPRTPKVDWAMCLRGTACPSCNRMTFNLVKPGGSIVCHAKVWFSYNGGGTKRVVINGQLNGAWGTAKSIYSFPFALGQPFEMEYRLLSLTELQIYVNGSVLLTHNITDSFAQVIVFQFFDINEGTTFDFVDLGSGCQ